MEVATARANTATAVISAVETDLVTPSASSARAITLDIDLPDGFRQPIDVFPVASPSERAWKSFVEKLGEDRTWFESYMDGPCESFPDKIAKRCASHKQASKLNKVNKLLRPICRAVGVWMPAIAAGAQADPYPSSIVVAGVLGVLQLSDGLENYQIEVIDWLNKISDIASALSDWDLCIYVFDVEIQNILEAIYEDILEFCAIALRLFEHNNKKRKTAAKVLGRTMVQKFPDKFGEIIKNLNGHMEKYDRRAKKCDAMLALDQYIRLKNMGKAMSHMQGQLGNVAEGVQQGNAGIAAVGQGMHQLMDAQTNASQSLRQDAKALVQSQNSTTNAVQELTHATIERQDQKRVADESRRRQRKKTRVHQWLRPVDFSNFLRDTLKPCITGSGTWLLTNSTYLAWREGQSAWDILAVVGKPGCGKSTLAVQCLKALQEVQNNKTVGIGYFFCKSTSHKRSGLDSILATMIYHLSAQCTDLNSDIEKAFDTEIVTRSNGPSVDQAERALVGVCSSFDHVYLLLDGIDELKDPTELLQFLSRTITKCHRTKMRIILFGRMSILDDYHFSTGQGSAPFATAHCIDVNKSTDDKSANYVDMERLAVDRFSKKIKTWPAERINDTKSQLLKKADGVFLYLELTLDRFRDSQTEDETDEILKDLPKDLEQLYEQTLTRAIQDEQRDGIRRDLVCRIFLWIANVERPLSDRELLEALSIEIGTSTIDPRKRRTSDADFTSLCRDLICVDQHGYYSLIHASLATYLKNLAHEAPQALHHYQKLQLCAQDTVGRTCLTYLSFDDFSSGPCMVQEQMDELKKEHPFLHYAAFHWAAHVSKTTNQIELVWQFLDMASHRRLCMQINLQQFRDSFPYRGSVPVLHLLARCGLYSDLYKSQDFASELVSKDAYGFFPRDYSMFRSSEECCVWFLKQELAHTGRLRDDNAFGTLRIAIDLNWPEVYTLAIREKLEIDRQWTLKNGKMSATPLARAAAIGNEKAASALIEAGADANLVDPDGDNALMAAIGSRNMPIAQLLLDKVSDIDHQNIDGTTALHYAADSGDVAVLSKILAKKPKLLPTFEQTSCQHPIHVAVERNHVDCTKALMKYDNKSMPETIEGFQPLHIAALHDSVDAAQVLIERNASTRARNKTGLSVLESAATNGCVKMLDYLHTIDPGCYEEPAEENTTTVLHLAAEGGHHVACQKLLEYGHYNVNAKSENGQTALHRAVQASSIETAKALLDHQADQDARGIWESPPLYYAANLGRSEWISLLLGYSANPTLQNWNDDAPLHTAAALGHTQFVTELVRLRPDIELNQKGNEGSTAIVRAAQNGHLEIVRYLIAKDVRTDLTDSSKNLPIHYVTWFGDLETFRLLYKKNHLNVKGYKNRSLVNICAIRGHTSILDFLLDEGADFESSDFYERTPLMNAIAEKHASIVTKLFDKTTDYQKHDSRGFRLLHFAAEAGNLQLVSNLRALSCDMQELTDLGTNLLMLSVESDQVELMDYLLGEDLYDVKATDKAGSSLFEVAFKQGRLETVWRLIRAGCMPSGLDIVGQSCLGVAARYGWHWLITTLESLGSRVDRLQEWEWPALISASSAGHVLYVQSLLVLGADVNCPHPVDLRTPLHCAAANRNVATVRTLVDHGADRLAQDIYGYTPIDYARDHEPSLEAMQIKTLDDPGENRAQVWKVIETTLSDLQQEVSHPVYSEETSVCHAMDILTTAAKLLGDEGRDLFRLFAMRSCFESHSKYVRNDLLCSICRRSITDSAWLCPKCFGRAMCVKCRASWTESGEMKSLKEPEGWQALRRLEMEVEGLRRGFWKLYDIWRWVDVRRFGVTLMLTDHVIPFINEMSEKFAEWNKKYNSNSEYESHYRPGQMFTGFLIEQRKDLTLLCASNDESLAASMKARLNAAQFKSGVEVEPFSFSCDGHEYFEISMKEFDRMRETEDVFGGTKKHGFNEKWLNETILQCHSASRIVPNTDSKTCNLLDRANSPKAAGEANISIPASEEATGIFGEKLRAGLVSRIRRPERTMSLNVPSSSSMKPARQSTLPASMAFKKKQNLGTTELTHDFPIITPNGMTMTADEAASLVNEPEELARQTQPSENKAEEENRTSKCGNATEAPFSNQIDEQAGKETTGSLGSPSFIRGTIRAVNLHGVAVIHAIELDNTVLSGIQANFIKSIMIDTDASKMGLVLSVESG